MRLPPFLIWLGLALAPLPALGQTLEELIPQLPEGSFGERAGVVAAIAATGDERAVAVLEALGEGDLHVRKADGTILKVTGRGSRQQGFDALTGAELGPVAARSTQAVRVNNALRRAIRSALATLTLRHPDPARRLEAANGAFQAADPAQVPALEAALAAEEDPGGRRGARRGAGGGADRRRRRAGAAARGDRHARRARRAGRARRR